MSPNQPSVMLTPGYLVQIAGSSWKRGSPWGEGTPGGLQSHTHCCSTDLNKRWQFEEETERAKSLNAAPHKKRCPVLGPLCLKPFVTGAPAAVAKLSPVTSQRSFMRALLQLKSQAILIVRSLFHFHHEPSRYLQHWGFILEFVVST